MLPLSPETERAVMTRVDSGLYESADDLVNQALVLLDEALERELQIGRDSGPGIVGDHEFFERKRQRLIEQFGKQAL